MRPVNDFSLFPPPGMTPAGGRVRLRTVVLIRWVALAGQVVTLTLVHFGFGLALPLAPALVVVLLSGALNVALQVTRPKQLWLQEREAAFNLAFDLVQLAALLALTGGLSNPFAILILAPVTLSATILSPRSTAVLSMLAIVLVSLLALWHLPLPWPDEPFAMPVFYRLGVWSALVIALVFIAAYVSFIAEEARGMSEALTATQMALAREQRLSALGGLAAAAAHELGSPLGTIAVVARELERELPADSPWHEDMELLVAESKRCREILARLADNPEDDGGEPYNRIPVAALVETAAAPYARDGIDLEIEAGPLPEGPREHPTVVRSPEIIHGLGTLLQNAMQFARHRVWVEIAWDAEWLIVTIADDGPGFDPGVLTRLGEPYVSTGSQDARGSSAGQQLGLGIFIAQTLLGHAGASLRFRNPREGGAEVEIRWRRNTLSEVAEGLSDARPVKKERLESV